MHLRQLMQRVPGLCPEGVFPDMELTGVNCDSRRIAPGELYVAVPGVVRDGHDFLEQAAARGAAACVVSRSDVMFPGAVLRTADPRASYARIVREFAGRPDEELCMLGVTGTNGKTTTAYLMAALAESRSPGGLLSTVEVRTPKTRKVSDCTTPDARTFHQLLQQVRDEGGKFLSMELSSHSLDQSRTAGVQFQAAVFTNLTGDHLDYHKTMENYFAAKCRLFTEELAGRAVINIDDPWGRKLLSLLKNRDTVTFGQSPDADCRITREVLTAEGSRCVLVRDGREFPVFTPMAGRHNLFNLAGAMLAAEVFGVPFGQAAAPVVPGRLEPLRNNGVTFFIDYAHTDDALAQALRAVRPLTRGKVLAVFGCGGDRDRTKRPRMGHEAAKGADISIVTSDNPRSENPQTIMEEILSGIPAGTRVYTEPDRKEALRLAVKLAQPGDCVLVAGKGHENYQEIAGIRHPFADAEVLKILFREEA